MRSDVIIRAATTGDIAQLCGVNAQSTPGVTPLQAGDFTEILANASYVRVAEVSSRCAGYVIAYRDDAASAGEEFDWFRERYASFLYIDQVAVQHDLRSAGIGARLYQDAFAWATRFGLESVTCEVHLNPPNPGSMRFHARHGFQAVQELDTADGRTVALLVRPVRERDF